MSGSVPSVAPSEVDLLARLACPAERGLAASELARRLGGEALLVFVWDAEVRMYLAAPGFEATLPRADGWQEFLRACADAGWLARELPFSTSDRAVPVTGIGWREEAVFAVVGAALDRGPHPGLLRLAAAALRAEYEARLQAARAQLAGQSAARAGALARRLDEARRSSQSSGAGECADPRAGGELRPGSTDTPCGVDAEAGAAGLMEEFTAAAAHELRAPLNPVLLVASEAAANPALPAAVRADFEMIAANVALEAALIDDLVDLLRMMQGEVGLACEPVPVNELLARVLARLAAELRGRNLTVLRDVPPVGAVVRGDPLRLQQIFRNVVADAVRVTPAGGAITVRSRIVPVKSRWRLEVDDTGPVGGGREGRRADAVRAGAGQMGGPRLGVAIARALAELHGGSLIGSGPRPGPAFVVELPLLGHPHS